MPGSPARRDRALAMHPQRSVTVLLAADEIVVAVGVRAPFGLDPEQRSQFVRDPFDHRPPAEARIREGPIMVARVRARGGRTRGEISVARRRRVDVSDRLADPAGATVQHEPQITGWISLDLDEVITAAERAELNPADRHFLAFQSAGRKRPFRELRWQHRVACAMPIDGCRPPTREQHLRRGASIVQQGGASLDPQRRHATADIAADRAGPQPGMRRHHCANAHLIGEMNVGHGGDDGYIRIAQQPFERVPHRCRERSVGPHAEVVRSVIHDSPPAGPRSPRGRAPACDEWPERLRLSDSHGRARALLRSPKYRHVTAPW